VLRDLASGRLTASAAADLPGEVRWRPFPGSWGLKGLPVEFDAAEAST
jgi:hypothetical protein